MTSRPEVQRSVPAAAELLAVPPELAGVAARQHGVLTRSLLHGYGFTERQTARALAAQRWRAVGPSVIVLGNAPLTLEQRQWAAVLSVSKPCALAAESAATAAGLRGFEPERVHLLVPHDTHVRVPAWVRLHESRRFGPADILLGGGPPRTSVTRSVMDAATWSRSPRRACALLCAGVQQRLTTPAALEAAILAAGRIRHRQIMVEVLGDIAGGGHTLAEINLGALARRAGLRPPRRQALRRDAQGRTRYLDAEFDLPDGTVLVVEVDGIGHLNAETWNDDNFRENEVRIDGSPVFRFSSIAVRLSADRVVDQLRRMRVAHL